jgi:hypothetical protein
MAEFTVDIEPYVSAAVAQVNERVEDHIEWLLREAWQAGVEFERTRSVSMYTPDPPPVSFEEWLERLRARLGAG